MSAVRARARQLAGRCVGWAFEAAGGPPPGLTPGRVEPALDARPVVIVLLLEAEAEAVAQTAADLVAATAAGGPRPVLVLDRPHFAAARRAGVVADHVLSAKDWAARGLPGPWEDHLAAELDRLRRDLASRHVVTLPAGGSRALDPAAWQAALTPPRRPGPLRRALVRLERRLDHPSGGW